MRYRDVRSGVWLFVQKSRARAGYAFTAWLAGVGLTQILYIIAGQFSRGDKGKGGGHVGKCLSARWRWRGGGGRWTGGRVGLRDVTGHRACDMACLGQPGLALDLNDYLLVHRWVCVESKMYVSSPPQVSRVSVYLLFRSNT